LRKMCLSTTPPLATANAAIGASPSAAAAAMPWDLSVRVAGWPMVRSRRRGADCGSLRV
jgi:hypothetical protein